MEGERRGRKKGGAVQIWEEMGRSTEGQEFESRCVAMGRGETENSH